MCTYLGDQRVGEGGLAVVDVRDDGHVPDVLLLVHAFSHLVCCEVNLEVSSNKKQNFKSIMGVTSP